MGDYRGRPSNIDGAAGALDEVKRIVAQLRSKWPEVKIVLRGEMENRIKEQMCLFAYRLSTEEMKGNQLRLYLSALAYTLVEALRRLALKGTEWAQAQVDTIRLKLFKVGALVRISARRVWLELNSTYPWKSIYVKAFNALRC